MNTTRLGDAFEHRIYRLIKSELDADRFFVRSDNCRIFQKKGYYSKDREKEIVFDISIEVFRPGATEYSFLVLIECKRYTHSVPVDDVEEFFAKIQQVGAAAVKGIIAAESAFQSGTLAYARSKHVGLIRCLDTSSFKWELNRSASASPYTGEGNSEALLYSALSSPDFHSRAFDLYFQSARRRTASLWEFFESLFLESIAPGELRSISNLRTRLVGQVPFLEKDEIEDRSTEILKQIAYSDGQVAFDTICDLERQRNKLEVAWSAVSPNAAREKPMLGRITFDPLRIEIYATDPPNRGRDRFTFAHELAHHLLGHGAYMRSESCDEEDFLLDSNQSAKGGDISRMEFQANYFASSLLLPRINVIEDFDRITSSLNIKDKGFGALYLDKQPINVLNFRHVTSKLMLKYGVSRAATKIRLEALGLLRDETPASGSRHAKS